MVMRVQGSGFRVQRPEKDMVDDTPTLCPRRAADYSIGLERW
jgi:hypothetical protein